MRRFVCIKQVLRRRVDTYPHGFVDRGRCSRPLVVRPSLLLEPLLIRERPVMIEVSILPTFEAPSPKSCYNPARVHPIRQRPTLLDNAKLQILPPCTPFERRFAYLKDTANFHASPCTPPRPPPCNAHLKKTLPRSTSSSSLN